MTDEILLERTDTLDKILETEEWLKEKFPDEYSFIFAKDFIITNLSKEERERIIQLIKLIYLYDKMSKAVFWAKRDRTSRKMLFALEAYLRGRLNRSLDALTLKALHTIQSIEYQYQTSLTEEEKRTVKEKIRSLFGGGRP